MKTKRLTAALIAVLLTFPTGGVTLASENTGVSLSLDFEAPYNEQSLKKDFDIGEGGGSVKLSTLPNGNTALLLENENDGAYTTVTRSFGATIKNAPITVSLSFMQKDAKADGSVILALGKEGSDIASLETESGNIVYRSGGITYAVIVKNYTANRFYDLTVAFDLSASTATVKLGGDTVAQGLSTKSGEADCFTSYTSVSPGYYIDNLSIENNQRAASVAIETSASINEYGKAELYVPTAGEREYSFTAAIYDENNIKIKNATASFSVSPTLPQGITKTESGDTLTLKITSDDIVNKESLCATEYELYVQSADGANKRLNFNFKEDTAAKIKIQGPARICWRDEDKNTFSYTPVFVNQNGEEMPGGGVVWSVSADDAPAEALQGILLDSATGTLTTSCDLTQWRNTRIKLTAVSADNAAVKGEYPIMLLDWKTCMQDNDRVDALKAFANEAIRVGHDRWLDTPLISDGFNVMTDMPYEWRYPVTETNPAPAALSDLASQGSFMRVLDGLSDITYDKTYTERVDSIYKYYVDNYMSSPSGLPYWGGHTAIDLKTGKATFGTPEIDTHELKDNFPYMDPFARIDSTLPGTIAKRAWNAHISTEETKDNLDFNRHAKFSKETDTESWWDYNYDISKKRDLAVSRNLSFHLVVNDFIYLMTEAFEHDGDVTDLRWAYRLWKRYDDVCDDVTKLGGYQASTAKGWEVNLPEGWYNEHNPVYQYTSNGDRAYNQYAQPMIDALTDPTDVNYGIAEKNNWDATLGSTLEEKKAKIEKMVRDANVAFGPGYMTFASQTTDLLLCEQIRNAARAAELNGDTAVKNEMNEYADNIEYYSLRRLASYSRLAYLPDLNKLKVIWTDGTDMTGFVCKYRGYYHYTYDNWVERMDAPTDEMLYAYITTFIKTGDATQYGTINGYDYYDDRKQIWDTIKSIAYHRGLGSFGKYDESTNSVVKSTINLNLTTTSTSGSEAMLMCYLYAATGMDDYLDMARKIANNILENNFHNNMFKDSTGYKNVRWTGVAGAKPYSFLVLEYAIRGEIDKIQYYCSDNGIFTANLLEDESDRYQEKVMSTWNAWQVSIPSVLLQWVKTDEAEYHLSVGDTREIELTYYPSDASSKEIRWFNHSPEVARFNSETNVITAVKKGTAVFNGYSADKNTTVSFKVIVE